MRFFKARSKETLTGRGSVTLVCTSLRFDPASAVGMTAEEVVRLLTAFRSAAIDVVVEFAGQPFRGVADILTAAWLPEGPQSSPACRDLAYAFLAQTRAALEKVGGPSSAVGGPCLAMCRGTCTYTTRGGRVIWVLGTPVAAVERMAENRQEEGDVVLVDHSLVTEFSPSELTDLGDGLYSLDV